MPSTATASTSKKHPHLRVHHNNDIHPQGQGGPAIELAHEKMNADEKTLVETLFRGPGEASIADLSAKLGDSTLRVRNALRRLVRGDWLTHVDPEEKRGVYKLSTAGKRRANKVFEMTPAKPPAQRTKIDAGATTDVAEAKARARAMLPELPDKDVDTAVLILAIRDLGSASDTQLHKATGLSRGFVIGRLKRLKAAQVDVPAAPVPMEGSDFQQFINIAQGRPA